MKSGKRKGKRKKENTTVRNFKQIQLGGGGGESQTESCFYHSESNVESSERSLLLFQNHQYREDIKEQQHYCHVRRRMVKSLYSVQS